MHANFYQEPIRWIAQFAVGWASIWLIVGAHLLNTGVIN